MGLGGATAAGCTCWACSHVYIGKGGRQSLVAQTMRTHATHGAGALPDPGPGRCSLNQPSASARQHEIRLRWAPLTLTLSDAQLSPNAPAHVYLHVSVSTQAWSGPVADAARRRRAHGGACAPALPSFSRRCSSSSCSSRSSRAPPTPCSSRPLRTGYLTIRGASRACCCTSWTRPTRPSATARTRSASTRRTSRWTCRARCVRSGPTLRLACPVHFVDARTPIA